jgi:hypothetical protein
VQDRVRFCPFHEVGALDLEDPALAPAPSQCNLISAFDWIVYEGITRIAVMRKKLGTWNGVPGETVGRIEQY